MCRGAVCFFFVGRSHIGAEPVQGCDGMKVWPEASAELIDLIRG